MITAIIDKLVSGLIEPLFTGGQEDCLFLDVYVPGSAVRSPSKSNLPVIHWFYGGGFVFGSKDEFEGATLPFYDGTGMIKQSGNNVIYVASNYRLGAFGFLAGTTMEKNGLPNAGFWDQRAALQWTQDNIHLLGGDPTQVTAMGESAGAGSILHHLTAGGGTIKPLFKRAVMLSPAFQPMWDRTGGLENVYKQFESLAGCSGQGLSCLRNASTETLLGANLALDKASVQGSFNVGPAVDGSFVRQLPALELASGSYNKDVDALLISHTANEATLFVDGHIATDAEFTTFLGSLFSPVSCSASLHHPLTDLSLLVRKSSRFVCCSRELLPTSWRWTRQIHRGEPKIERLHPRQLHYMQRSMACISFLRKDVQHAILYYSWLACYGSVGCLLGYRL